MIDIDFVKSKGLEFKRFKIAACQLNSFELLGISE